MAIENQLIRNVFNHYGPRKTDSHFGGIISEKVFKTVQWTFDYTQLGTSIGIDVVGSTNQLEYSIPANSSIISARFIVISAWVSTSTTSDLDVGLEQADGTDIDLDGFLTAAQLTQTVLGVVGGVTVGTGALVGKTIGTAAGELIVTPTADDFTAGKARLIVEYLTQGL